MYQPIEDYGIIGDLHSVALVGKNGSIDLMSFPRFDSPTIFAALLDDETGGRFCIRPVVTDGRNKQMYLPDTNILLTRFLSDEGVGEISDFMPVGFFPHDHPRVLVRRVKTVRGVLRYSAVFEPRFDYGRADHSVEEREMEWVFASKGADGTAVRLRTAVPMTVTDNGAAVATFELRAGESAAFIMEEVGEGMPSPTAAPDYEITSFKDTQNFWRNWIGRSRYQGRWRETVNRSALALKLMFSQTYGSLVAAPTFGLPERIGGERNWDYRYTWIRDAAFSLYALLRLGFTDEAEAFMSWLTERFREGKQHAAGPLQIMYGHDGTKTLTEQSLPHLEGYRCSSPVRIGNGAYDQL
ncbi:MAG TPA: glycoside hydrolase family 15 protein, partial [Acidimicrobiia bacterium]|nr:glycoside hydrolase family 15 protein [Acidimicrobiia bacterium]